MKRLFTTPLLLLALLTLGVNASVAQADGRHVSAAEEMAGAPRQAAAADTTPPAVVAPVVQLLGDTALGKTMVPARVTWSATDATGIAGYELEASQNGGGFTKVTLSSPTDTGVSRLLTPGASYSYRVRATDGQGNASGWAQAAAFKVRASQESDPGITYSGTWAPYSNTGYYGGSARYSTTPGSTATLTFSGSSVAWISTRYKNRGIAEVWLDGAKVATVDLYSATLGIRSPVWHFNGLSSPRSHTLQVRVLGTRNPASGSARVDLDAFVIGVPGAPTEDLAAPVVQPPVAGLISDYQLGTGTVPVGLTWSAFDESGIRSYELQESKNSAAFANVPTTSMTGTSTVRWVTPAISYAYGVRATDGNGQGRGYNAAVQTILPGGKIIGGWCVEGCTARIHHGIDVQAQMGAPVYSLEPGKITWIATNGTGGNMVSMTDDLNRRHFFAHFDRPSSHLTVGQRVSRGDLIGNVGMTGNAQGTVPHLHYQISVPGGDYADPAKVLADWDGGGALSEWAVASPFSVEAQSETSPNIAYTGAWSTFNHSSYHGGYVRYAASSAYKAAFTFTGTSVAWVSTKNTNRGRAEVWLDGAKAATVDLYASSLLFRRTVFVANGLSSGAHTLEIRPLGAKSASSSGTRVDIDAFLTLR